MQGEERGLNMSNNLRKVMDALHGGVAEYHKEKDEFIFRYCSERIVHLLGCKKAELCSLTDSNALEIVCESERKQVEQALRAAMQRGTGLNTYFRVKNKKNLLKWCQLDSWKDEEKYFVLFSGLTPEMQLFQNIAGETADDIYVISKENYDLFYANEFKNPYCREEDRVGRKCYQVLYGKKEPCDFCTLKKNASPDAAEEIVFEENGRFFATRCRETDWNGEPAYVIYVRDITEEEANRREKERLEQYFQTVLKYLPGGMAVVHHEVGGSLSPEYLSDGFAEMLGMSHESAWKMYRENALSGVHPDDREYVRENLDQCIKERRERYELQYRLRKEGGGYIWVNAKFSVIQCKDGDARVYVDYHDVTAEKKMQEQLQQQYNEQIHQHYLLAGPDVLTLGHCNVTKNKIYEIVDHTNSGLRETFGDDRENFFTGVGTFIPDEKERKEFYAKYLNEPSRQAYDKGEREIIMTCYMELPGQKNGRYVQFKVTLVETPDTKDITGILMVTDITEKTIREKIFMQLSSENYDLVANVNLFSDTYEIVSGGDKNISEKQGFLSEWVQRAIQNMVFHSEREKEYVEDMLNPSSILKRLKNKKSFSFSYSIYDAKGEILTKNMIVSAVDIRLGRVCFIRADVTDVLIAERKAKEDLERALEEAKKANRVKSDFLSSMSHDIRTPMNAIVGMTTLALANLDSRDKIQDYLQKISVSSQHLLSLINDVLDMSQIEQSRIHLNHQIIKIEELVNHVASIMMSPAENAGIQLQIETCNLRQEKFWGDTLRITQILINLLSNAVKFTMEGGRVLFRTEEIRAKEEKHVRYCFTVQDSGIGMGEEFLRHLFEPFIRSDQVSRVEGTGLGLSITKGLVDLMGGEIRVESRQQQGTKFEIELEFEQADNVENQHSGENSQVMEEDLSGCHFLLVEDNEINSEILGELLQMQGATFTVKTDGLQAVNEFKLAKPGTYDAVFMDIQMPVMNGYEAAREIRRLDHPDAESIIILAMTANAFAEDVHAALEAGMDGHIAKPVDMKLLYHTISAMLKKRKE